MKICVEQKNVQLKKDNVGVQSYFNSLKWKQWERLVDLQYFFCLKIVVLLLKNVYEFSFQELKYYMLCKKNSEAQLQ